MCILVMYKHLVAAKIVICTALVTLCCVWLRPCSRLYHFINADRDCKEYVASSIKAVLARYSRVLGTDLLEGIPRTTSNHIFNKELMDFVTSSKWTQFMENKVHTMRVRSMSVTCDCRE